jgi:hypothetical protein
MFARTWLLLMLATVGVAAQAQTQDHRPAHAATAPPQKTAPNGMIMDHSHEFELTPDGGFIQMQRESEDAERVRQIRLHIEDIARLFKAGDFRLPPGTDYAKEVPGTRMMKERLSKITFTSTPLPLGARLAITSGDSAAREAIQKFLDFHRQEHRAMQ